MTDEEKILRVTDEERIDTVTKALIGKFVKGQRVGYGIHHVTFSHYSSFGSFATVRFDDGKHRIVYVRDLAPI